MPDLHTRKNLPGDGRQRIGDIRRRAHSPTIGKTRICYGPVCFDKCCAARALVPTAMSYASQKLDNYPEWSTLFSGVGYPEWCDFVAVSGIFVAVSTTPVEYYRELVSIVQADLEGMGYVLHTYFENCQDFCGEYLPLIPAEYDQRLSDLLATWGALGLLRRDFVNFHELDSLREICANVEVTFSNWWEKDDSSG